MQRLVVLHQRPMGESNWLLNIFSEQDGHQLVLAPRRAGRLALWQLYQGEWRSDKDWPRMTVSDRLSELKYQRQQLFCCTYLSELLIQLLPMADAQPQLFQRFLTLLEAMQTPQALEPWLRIFEYQLLQALGFGFDWHQTAEGQPVQSGRSYQFRADVGLLEIDARQSAGTDQTGPAMTASQGLPGQALLELADGAFNRRNLAVAKQVLRLALSQHLSKPLVSRQLFAMP